METNQEALAALRRGKAPPERSRDYWSKEDIETLTRSFWAYYGISQIALEMGRSEIAVFQKLLKMGLFDQQSSGPRPKRPKPENCGCLCPACSETDCPNYGKEQGNAGRI